VELNPNARPDPSQVEDLRGSRSGGRRRSSGPSGAGTGVILPIPRLGNGKLGGALIALLVLGLIGCLCLGAGKLGLSDLGALGGLGGLSGDGQPGSVENEAIAQTCSTANPDHLDDPGCRNLLYVNSIQAYWQTALPQIFAAPYQTATTRFFSGQVTTACGTADSGAGPFYCPADHHVAIDLTFYQELADRFGAKGEFAQPYVLAHEYGHHIQSLLGTQEQVRRAQQRDPGNADAYSVGLELQADCYAGVWAYHASETTDAGGAPIFASITAEDITQALGAAAAVGDDTIQRRAGQKVNEESFTHGSAAQRQQWFTTGSSTGDPKQCNTFGAALPG
jgi:hypothetical protein